MGFVVTADNILNEEVTQASVYLDACFILAAINIDDHRYELVMKVLDHMADQGIRLVTNAHVTSEVVSNLLKIKILRALQVYHEYISIPPNRQRPLTAEQNKELIHFAATKAIYDQAKAKGFLNVDNRRKVNCNPYNLLKFLKQLPRQRVLLAHFYKSAQSTYREFKELLRDYGFTIEYGVAGEDTELLALAYTHLYQLDMPDALHLACARWERCDLFLTLDGDFEVGNYTTSEAEDEPVFPEDLATLEEQIIRIFKVA